MFARRGCPTSTMPMFERDIAIEQAAAQRVEDLSRTLVLLWASLVVAFLLWAPLLLTA